MTRLLFNATNLCSEGGVVLMLSLLRHIMALEPGLEILLYLNPALEQRVSAVFPDCPRLTVVAFRPQGMWRRLFWEQISLPKILRRQKIDILLSFGNTGPLFPGCRQVLYVQQSIPFTDYQPDSHRLSWWRFKLIYGTLMALAQLGSQRILVPTRWLVKPMQRSVLGLKSKTAYQVSLPGVPELSDCSSSPQLSDSEIELLEKLERWRASGNQFILYPCYLAPYKHIPYLADAIRQLETMAPPDYRLLLTIDSESLEYFPGRDEVFRALSALPAERLVLTGSLSRLALNQIYAMTDVLAFPSLVETLGLPLLEALSRGIPIVATQSDKPDARQAAFSREICGSAALYADPEKPGEFAERLRQIMTDAALWERLRQTGLQRAQNLSWEAHVQAILGF